MNVDIDYTKNKRLVCILIFGGRLSPLDFCQRILNDSVYSVYAETVCISAFYCELTNE